MILKALPTFSGIYNHAGVRLGQKKSIHSDEFLWSPDIQRAIPPLGLAGLLPAPRELRLGGPPGDGGGPLLLLPRGHFPQPARRI